MNNDGYNYLKICMNLLINVTLKKTYICKIEIFSFFQPSVMRKNYICVCDIFMEFCWSFFPILYLYLSYFRSVLFFEINAFLLFIK